MANITPNTDIYILKGVPLDKDNDITLFWGMSGDAINRQANYFLGQNGQRGFVKYHLDKLSYQRVGNNRIRVGYGSYSNGMGFPASAEGQIADVLQDCNYIVFANTVENITPRWYYAFITEPPTYINPNTAEIQYEIDPLQTWLPGIDYNFEECFVLREHIIKANDTLGANIEAEPIEPGEYIFATADGMYSDLTDFSHHMITVAMLAKTYVSSEQEYTFQGSFIDNNYSGLVLIGYDNNDSSFLKSMYRLLFDVKAQPDTIMGFYTIPKAFIKTTWDNNSIMPLVPYPTDLDDIDSGGWLFGSGGKFFPWNTKIESDVIDINGDDIPVMNMPIGYAEGKSKLGAHIPRNNKLYTYPYNFYCVDNSADETMVLRYEFFPNGQVKLKGYPTISTPTSVVFKPYTYKNTAGFGDNTETITVSGFPLCAWISDYYQAYMAQNSLSIGANALLGLGRVGVGIATGNPFAMIGGTSSIVDSISQAYSASIHADVPHGKFQNTGGFYAHKAKELHGGRMCVTTQKAKVIDEFFTRYGYATNRLKTPGIANRKYFNYVKTEKCAVKSNSNTGNRRGVPADEAKKICDFMNRGLTWWNGYADNNTSADHIGDFMYYYDTN